MTVALRVIPCLDVDDGRVVKGVNFENLRDAGDPIELAKRYDAEGADELTFLDITASSGDRQTTYDVVRGTAEQVFIPLTVGGGVRSADDVNRLLREGADKVGVNTAAIARPELIGEIAERFGSQVLVLSVDARRTERPAGNAPPKSGFEVTTHGGRQGTGIDALEWIARAQQLGAGEILLNSMDADGTASGFDIELIAACTAYLQPPPHREWRGRRNRAFRRRGRCWRGCGPCCQCLPLRPVHHRGRQGKIAKRRLCGPLAVGPLQAKFRREGTVRQHRHPRRSQRLAWSLSTMEVKHELGRLTGQGDGWLVRRES